MGFNLLLIVRVVLWSG